MVQPKSDKQITYAVMGRHEKSLMVDLPDSAELQELSGTALTGKRVETIQKLIKKLAEQRYEFYRDYLAKKGIDI